MGPEVLAHTASCQDSDPGPLMEDRIHIDYSSIYQCWDARRSWSDIATFSMEISIFSESMKILISSIKISDFLYENLNVFLYDFLDDS